MSINYCQSLFNWKIFYQTKSNKIFPSSLCFPEFFAISISMVLRSYSKINSKKSLTPLTKVDNASYSLAKSFLKCLQTIVNMVYGFTCQIYVKPISEIEVLIAEYIIYVENVLEQTQSMEINTDIYCLEYFLKDANSIYNYRKLLIETSLKYYNVKNINDLIEFIIKDNCCGSELINEVYKTHPSSKHYILPLTNSFTNLPFCISGPRRWGPYLWNMFHSLCDNINEDDLSRDNVLYTINSFIRFLLHLSFW